MRSCQPKLLGASCPPFLLAVLGSAPALLFESRDPGLSWSHFAIRLHSREKQIWITGHPIEEE